MPRKLSPTGETAAKVRAAIRAARQAGKLDQLPAASKISVTCETGSLHSAITVRIAVEERWGVTAMSQDAIRRLPNGTRIIQEAWEIADVITDAYRAVSTGYTWFDVQLDHGDTTVTIGSVTPDHYRPGQD